MYLYGKFEAGAAFLVLLLAIGCSHTTEQTNTAWTSKGSWYREPATDLLWQLQEAPLDRTRFAGVQLSKETVAENLLADAPFCPIDPEQAGELLAKELESDNESEFYLLRGVYLHDGTGSFVVYVKESNVLVHHGCLGRNPVPMKRRAIVALLPNRPTEVYVTCSMDE
jgi:hypothetical protein